MNGLYSPKPKIRAVFDRFYCSYLSCHNHDYNLFTNVREKVGVISQDFTDLM